MPLCAIEPLIPHRAPFRFVDAAVHVDATGGDFVITLSPDDERLTSGYLAPLLLVEALTQSAAAWHGTRQQTEETGVLAQIERARLYGAARGGERVLLHVERERVLGNLARFVGSARRGDETLADAVFTVRRGDAAMGTP